MRIVIMVEGKTEQAFKSVLHDFVKQQFVDQGHLSKMPNLDFKPHHGGVPTGEKLKRAVEAHLSGKKPADHVVWLTDIYVDARNPGKGLWTTPGEARAKARDWVGNESRFHPHTACHDFEAWLLPYWDKIKKHSGSTMKSPGADPEKVNHGNPPAYRINEAYRTGKYKRSYAKTKDPQAILRDQDLMIAIRACSELKAFVLTILKLSGVNDKVLKQKKLL